MFATERAIVLHSFPFKENSRIVKVLTEKDKVVSLFINGFSKGKSKKSSIYYPGNIIELEWFEKQNNSLLSVRSEFIIESFSSIHQDFYKTSILSFIIECLYKMMKENQQLNGIYDYTTSFLELLEGLDSKLGNLAVIFLVDFTQFIGIKPKPGIGYFNIREGEFQNWKNEVYSLEKNLSEQLSKFLELSRRESLEVVLKGKERKQLLEKYLLFIDYHIDQQSQILSLEILSTVLSD